MDIVVDKEENFVNFFNAARAITIRKHSFELIPGVGKKHLRELLDERDEKAFESFEDIEKRCPFLGNPAKAIVKRIIQEMNNQEDFKLFVRK
jgi:putative nucleotide binding protein